MARRTTPPVDPENRENCRRGAAMFLRYAYVARSQERPDFDQMSLAELRQEADRMQADSGLPSQPIEAAVRALDAADEGQPFRPYKGIS